jgi:hypothetical protein
MLSFSDRSVPVCMSRICRVAQHHLASLHRKFGLVNPRGQAETLTSFGDFGESVLHCR